MIKIISGGQTGVDRIALELAKEMGFETGGYAPKGYLTENGSDLTLKEFGLIETEIESYPYRTKKNIQLAHGTILFGDDNSKGSKLVIRYCHSNFYPLIINPDPNEIHKFIKDLDKITKPGTTKIINIAGNRGSNMTIQQIALIRQMLKLGLINFK